MTARGSLHQMAARLKARPEILDRRREMVEHPFGSIKQCMAGPARNFCARVCCLCRHFRNGV